MSTKLDEATSGTLPRCSADLTRISLLRFFGRRSIEGSRRPVTLNGSFCYSTDCSRWKPESNDVNLDQSRLLELRTRSSAAKYLGQSFERVDDETQDRCGSSDFLSLLHRITSVDTIENQEMTYSSSSRKRDTRSVSSGLSRSCKYGSRFNRIKALDDNNRRAKKNERMIQNVWLKKEERLEFMELVVLPLITI